MRDKEKLVAAFNEWMRRYIEEPERFRREIQSVREFLAEEQGGKQPSYGQRCAVYLLKLMDEAGVDENTPSPPCGPSTVAP